MRKCQQQFLDGPLETDCPYLLESGSRNDGNSCSSTFVLLNDFLKKNGLFHEGFVHLLSMVRFVHRGGTTRHSGSI